MAASRDLADKSIQAAIAAIEVYNKPNFSYREEAFSLLMANAWELLLKAKWTMDHGEEIESLYETVSDSTGSKIPKTNRSGNPLSFGINYLASRLVGDRNSGLERECYDNISALVEIRDNAAHFFIKDIYLGRRILEIGTASLRNYMQLAGEWFQLDLSAYNFFLMPISFYHGFEAAEPISRSHYAPQVQKLLEFLDKIEAQDTDPGSKQHVSLRLETKLVRAKDASAVAFRWTEDPSAPALTVREEDVRKNYPMTYKALTDALINRYSNFSQNAEYHRLRKLFEKEKKYSIVRILDPALNPKSPSQRFYNANILREFDKHYHLRKKSA